MKKILISSVCFFLLLFMVGCGSDPEVEEEQKVPEVEPPVVVEPPPVVEEPVDPLIEENEALIGSVLDARKEAIEIGAENYFTNELQVIDIFANEALSAYENGGETQVFNTAATNSLYQYKALEQATLVAKARDKIEALEFEQYNQIGYDNGVKYSENAIELFNTGADGEAIYNEVVKAKNEFDAVLQSGFAEVAKVEKGKYLESQSLADEVKASVADKDNYAIAKATFAKAEATLSTDAEKAIEDYKLATVQMNEAYKTAYEKRKAAESYLEKANRSIERADEIAEIADQIAPQEEVEKLNEGEN